MPYSKRIIYLTEEQREELFSNNTITVDGVTIDYNENDIYMTPKKELDVQINGASIVNNGVANIPIATESSVGVCRTDPNFGTGIYSQRLMVARAPDDYIKNGANTYRPIVPSTQHLASFYGLAKAAGDTTQSTSSNPVGTYTDEAKAAIRTMLGLQDVYEDYSSALTALGVIE